MQEPSPFIFDGPLPPELVIGRQDEADTIRSWARAGRFVTVFAPRRYGKTSLLGKVASEAWDVDSMPVVLVDLYGLASLTDLVVRLERAYRRHAKGWFRRAVESAMRSAQLGLSLGGAGVSLTFAREPRTDPLPALHALLDLPDAIARRHDSRALVVFDEFQAVLAVERAEEVLRSHVQHQRTVASYVFAGSEPSLLGAVFADRARPFYGQAEPFRLGRLAPGPLADAIAAGFDETGRSVGAALDPLLELADGHPQRAMLVAHCLWVATPAGGMADDAAWSAAVEDVHRRTSREFEAVWDRLTANQRRALRAVEAYGSPFRREADAALGLRRSSATEAVEALVRMGDLERRRDRLAFVDPLFAAWIARRFP